MRMAPNFIVQNQVDCIVEGTRKEGTAIIKSVYVCVFMYECQFSQNLIHGVSFTRDSIRLCLRKKVMIARSDEVIYHTNRIMISRVCLKLERVGQI